MDRINTTGSRHNGKELASNKKSRIDDDEEYDEIDEWIQELYFPSEALHETDLRIFTDTLEKNIYQNIFNVYPLNYICDMRPLVRSEQIRLRMPKEVKLAIKEKAKELGITVTAYLESLVLKDLNETLLTKEEL